MASPAPKIQPASDTVAETIPVEVATDEREYTSGRVEEFDFKDAFAEVSCHILPISYPSGMPGSNPY